MENGYPEIKNGNPVYLGVPLLFRRLLKKGGGDYYYQVNIRWSLDRIFLVAENLADFVRFVSHFPQFNWHKADRQVKSSENCVLFSLAEGEVL